MHHQGHKTHYHQHHGRQVIHHKADFKTYAVTDQPGINGFVIGGCAVKGKILKYKQSQNKGYGHAGNSHGMGNRTADISIEDPGEY